MEGPGLASEERTWPLPWSVVEVGRADASSRIDPHVDLTPLDDDRSVSRRHARLVRSPGGKWTVRDIGSANGTSLDGARIAAGEDRPIGDGTRLGFGDVAVVFRLAVPWPEGIRPEWEDQTVTERSERAGFDPTGTVFGRRGPAPAAEPTVASKVPWYRKVFGTRQG